MVVSTFADRLWWARHRMGLGATRLARLVQCSQSLISSLERNNAEKSKLNNKFADALNVDPAWLAYGIEDKAPTGFDPDEARRGREAMATGGGSKAVNVVRLPSTIGPVEPRWASDKGAAPQALSPLQSVEVVYKRLVNDIQDFARLAGRERTKQVFPVLQQAAELAIALQEAGGHEQAKAINERHDSSDHD